MSPDLSLFDLSGRKALVTGASRGIGRRLAEGLAAAGADVALAARSQAALADSAAAVEALGRRAVPVALDVRIRPSVGAPRIVFGPLRVRSYADSVPPDALAPYSA